MKILTFLGTTNYLFAKYRYGKKIVPTRFFAEALPQFFPDTEKILVFVTPTVQKHNNLEELSSRLGDLLQPVPIPESHTEDALWQIFDALISNVDPGEEVIFDITSSLRSIPFVVFIAAAFLRSARNVQVKAVLYGAFEVKGDDNVSPVFDLTPFVTMFDWLVATDYFTETGDGRALAKLLKEQMPPGIQMSQDLDARKIGKSLRDASQAISDITLALRVARPMETMRASRNLVETINKTRDPVVHKARPFGVLVDEVVKEYGQFSLDKPEDSSNWKANLRNQLLMIQWYLEHEQTIQAVTLSREWVVSVLAAHFGKDLLIRSDRSVIEKMLNNAVEQSKAEPRPIEPTILDEQYQLLPDANEITSLWSRLTEVRNDIAHVGMRKSARPAGKLKEKARSFFPDLEKIARTFDLT